MRLSILYHQHGRNTLTFRVLTKPKLIYAHFSKVGSGSLNKWAGADRDRWKVSYCEPELGEGEGGLEEYDAGKGSLRMVSYVYDEENGVVKIYPMPRVVWRDIDSFLSYENSGKYENMEDLSSIPFKFNVEKNGSGLNTRYRVSSLPCGEKENFIPYEAKIHLNKLLKEQDILKILKYDLQIELENVVDEKVNRFELLDFE